MKDVAKCDTWCELQNPVNHRVFERKLRPKPSGRGHVCLGVTHRVAPRTASSPEGESPVCRGGPWLPVPFSRRGWPKCESGAKDVTTSGGWNFQLSCCRALFVRPTETDETLTRLSRSDGMSHALRPRPQVRRDYPLSLSISISGGKETYKDSPSNGERTGNSPA